MGSGALTNLTLTLYDEHTKAIINARDGTNILNAGPGTLDANGNGVITLAPADNPIVGSRLVEDHVALIEWAWEAGIKKGKHEIGLRVSNLVQVP